MPFEKGRPKTGGRQPGGTNKFTVTFRGAVQIVYHGLGGHAAFLEWAKNNQSEYYRIASKLIPLEVREKVDHRSTDGSMTPKAAFDLSTLSTETLRELALLKRGG